jgi:hypothetical protein
VVLSHETLEVDQSATDLKRKELKKVQAEGRWTLPHGYPREWPITKSDFFARIERNSTTTNRYSLDMAVIKMRWLERTMRRSTKRVQLESYRSDL